MAITAETQAKKEARRQFSDGASKRIAYKMHSCLARGEPVTTDIYRRWWDEEGKVAKAAGLYAASTYAHDAGTGLRRMAEERGWGCRP